MTDNHLTPENQLRNEIHHFINELLATAEDPARWPMTPQEQAAFIRTVMYKSRKIARTEPFMLEEVVMAAEALRRGK